ncbi:MAG: substrate-binding domain-containing protein [Clostridia bacterium]|nr:substrate-binding domain-containing protein [Clostridia bacterium]
MKKVLSFVLVLAVLMSTLVFFAVALAEDGKVIGVDLYYRRDEYYVDLESTFATYGAEQGYVMNIQDADGDVAKQIQQVEDFITAGVDAIAIAVADPDALAPVLEEAVAAGIPVVCYDGGANSDMISTKVIFDYAYNGQLCGEWAVNYIQTELADKDTVKVAILDFPASPVVCVPMADTFQATVEALGNVEIVARQDGKAHRADSMAAAENILTANPDIDIFYGINFDTGMGAVSAIQAANSNAVVICAGWASEGFEMLEANDAILKVMCANVPVIQAQDTVDAITKIYAGEELPKETLSMPMLLDASNIGEYDWESIVAARMS